MNPTPTHTPEAERALSRAELYRIFSRAFTPPPSPPVDTAELREGLRRLAPEADVLELPAFDADKWSRQHRALFGHTLSPDIPPYETFYGPAHIFRQTQDLADIAGFYTAWGLAVSAEAHERADHLCVELEFMAYLAVKQAHASAKGEKENAGLSRQAQVKFLSDHLGRWVPAFRGRLQAKSPDNVYARLAGALETFIRLDCRELGAEPTVFKGPEAVAPEEVSPCFSCGGAQPEVQG